MTTPGSRAGHTGADGSGPASADQGGTRGPGRPSHPSRGRHSADRGGRPPDDPDYEEDVYRDLYRRDDRYPADDRYPSTERYGERPADHRDDDRYREDDRARQDGGYRDDGGYREDDRYRDHQGADRYRDDDDVYNSLYRPEDRPRQPRGYSPRDGRGRRRPEEYPQQGAYRETESYDQPRGYTRTGGHPPTGNYDETDLHPAVNPDDPPRRGTVRRYGAARQDSTDLFPAASQAGAGWIEPDFATGEIAAVEAGWRANTGQWTVPVRRPGARQAPPAAEPAAEHHPLQRRHGHRDPGLTGNRHAPDPGPGLHTRISRAVRCL